MNIHFKINQRIRRNPQSLDPDKQRPKHINLVDTTNIKSKIFEGNDLKILPFDYYLKEFTSNEIYSFMLEEDIYLIPTEELCTLLDQLIEDNLAIEIGAGRGFLGRELGIITTDSHSKNDKFPVSMGNGHIFKYPDYIEKIDAAKAIRKYKPHTVIGSYIVGRKTYLNNSGTYGVDGKDLLKHCKRYFHIGNLDIHCDNPILSISHTELEFPYLITKNMNPDTDRIFIWGDDGLNNFCKINNLKKYKVTYEVKDESKYQIEFISSDNDIKSRADYWVDLDQRSKFMGKSIYLKVLSIQQM